MKKILTILLTFLVFHCGQIPAPTTGQAATSTASQTNLPPAPTNLRAVAGMTSMTVTWDAVPGAASYNLYWAQGVPVSVSSNKITGATSPVTFTGLISQAIYHYAVTAVYTNGESLLSQTATAETSIIDNDNGTVYIYAQNLTWAKCATATLTGGTTLQAYPYDCSYGSAGTFAFCAINDMSCDNGSVLYALGNYSAVWHACEGMTANHYQMRVWRVPTYVELSGMAGHYANNASVWDRMPSGFFWTADANPVRGVDIVNNAATTQARTVSGNVLCVSDGI